MQIEVNEKEAKVIYCERYYTGLGRKKHVPVAILVIALVLAVLTMTYAANDWLGVGVLVVLSAPSLFLTFRTAKDSGKYARRMIEEQK